MRTEDWKEHRDLWRRAFRDTERYMDYYFANKAPRSCCVEDRESGRLSAMAFFTPYEAVLYGRPTTLSYIVGVATEERFRGQGRMKKILRGAMEKQKGEGKPLVFLSPANPAVYRSLGFRPVYWRETWYLRGEGKACCDVYRWDELSLPQKEKVSGMAEHILDRERWDLRLVHSVGYYEETDAELQSLGGSLLTFWRGGEPLAVADWICENGEHGVTEWISGPEGREEALQTLLWYLKGGVAIEDTYFLQGVGFDGMRRSRQERPYLMVRMLDETVPVPGRCYINDIT